MGAEIDRLEVQIEASASRANAELNKLVNKLDKVASSLSSINGSGLAGFANGIEKLGKSMQAVNSVKTSDFTRLANNIQKLSQLDAGGLNTTSSALDLFGKSVSKSTKGIFSTFGSLPKHVTKVNKSMGDFSQTAGKFYARFFLLIRGLKKLGKAIETSMDYVETYNYFNVIMDKIGAEFGDMYARFGYNSAEEYAGSFSDRMNQLTQKMTGYKVGDSGELTLTDSIGLALDPQAVMNYQASIAAVTNSVGLIGENSVNVSKALTMLSADMSSLKNVDLSTAMTNFQSGIIGQSRALYKYGIDITNATLQTYAYDLGLSKSVSEMTQAEKMQLRMIAILDQSRVAWGDQANTINSVANQYRIMKQQVSNLARVIGNLLLPIVQKVLPVINGMIIALQRLFSVLGFKLWGGNWLKNTMDGISGGYADDSLGDLEDDANGAAGGLKDAGKAAEKLKTMVRGIDELNILSPDTGNDSRSGAGVGSGTGSIDLSDAIGAALADYESIWDEAFKNSQNKAQEYADAICDAFLRIWELAEPTREAIVRLWNEGLSKLGKFTFGTLKDFWQNFLKPVGSWMLGDNSGLPRFFNITNDLLNKINWSKLRTSLADFYRELERLAKFVWTGLMDFYDHFLAPIAVWTMSKGIPALVDTVTSLAKKIKWDKLNKALDSLFKVLSKFAVGIGQGLINFIETISPIVTSVLAGAINLIATALNGLATVLGMIPSSVVEGVGFALAGFFTVIYGGREISNIVIKIGIGLLNLKDAMNATFALLASQPWMVVAAGIGALVGALISLNKAAEEQEQIAVFGDKLSNITSKIHESTEAIRNRAQASMDLVQGAGVAETAMADDLAGKYFDLAEKENRTNEETEEMKRLTELLIEKVPELSQYYDEQSGILNTTRENVDKLIQSRLQEIQLNALEEALTKQYQEQANALLEVQKATEPASQAQAHMNKLQEEYNALSDKAAMLQEYESLGQQITNCSGNTEELLQKQSELWNQITNSGTEEFPTFASLEQKMEEVNQKIYDFQDEYTQAMSALAEPKELYDSIGTNISDLTDMLTKGMTQAASDSAAGYANEMKSDTSMADSTLKQADDLLAGFNERIGVHSPSTEFRDSAKYAIEGWVLGIEENKHIATASVTEFANALIETFNSVFSQGAWTESFSGMILGIEEVFGQFFENLLPASEEKLLLLDQSVINTLTQMNQKMAVIFTGITIMVMQKWTLMLNQTRLSWTQINNLAAQNLDLLNNRLVSGMTVANTNWSTKWAQFTARVRVACSEVQSAVSSLNDSVQSMCDSMMSAIEAVKAAASSMGSISISGASVRGFASGGYPETGELFMARENGINEMVGRIGNRSAVANNDQIVEAIRAAVVQGINADEQNTLLREQNALLRALLDKDVDVSLDGRSLVDGIDKARKRMGVNFQPV